MDYHVEEDYTVCANFIMPYIKTYCRTGFYVSVPFTAKNYYVIVRDPVEQKFVVYKVRLNSTLTFERPTDEELDEVKDTLHRASECIKKGGGECEKDFEVMSEEEDKKQDEENSKKNICINDVFRGATLKITELEKIDQSTLELLRQKAKEIRGRNITPKMVPEKLRPYISLVYRPNVVVYPDARPTKIQYLPILNEFLLNESFCGSLTPEEEESLKIPVAPPFNTELYKIVASAEVTNRCNNKSITNHIKCYLAYRVSRAVEYH